ncbi:hypothetical protein SpCBS45565_g04757 [Spizellomyces sp. 'palustris']|nr:hypothetical protein SpCBS45565_g04757 [Spizellomyces sp. 'palustris']
MPREPPFDLLKFARMRILLVPVHPIRRDTFRKYVDSLSQFDVVSLMDLTPPDSSRSQSKFTEQMYHHEGYLHINYVTSYNKEHLPFEEFQLYRQIVGVIGIMHCQQVDSIGEGYKRFQNILSRYPSVLASRCFAFEPTEQQADDTRGCIMIPDDPKKLSFYLMTQINDLANELLVAFGNLAAHFDKRPMISGPLMPSSIASTPISAHATTFPASPASFSPTMQSLPSSASILQSPSLSASLPLSGVSTPIREGSAPLLSAQDSTASMLGLGNLFTPDKTKKRTPARAQKLIADLFLMAGRVDLATSSYSSAIETMKATGDYQWQAAAMEAYYCALILSLLPKTGLWPSTEDSPSSESASPTGSTGTLGRQPLRSPTYSTIFAAAQSHPQFRMLICDIPDRYREIASLYERSFQPGHPGFYPLLHIHACLDMARYLAAMWVAKFNGPVTNGAGVMLVVSESKGIADIASNIGLSGSGTRAASTAGTATTVGPAFDKDRIILNGGLGTSKVDVSTWVMRAWASGVEYLTLSDQIGCVTSISTAYAQIGYKKKHAFFLRQTALLLLATLKGNRKARVSMSDVSEIGSEGGRSAQLTHTRGLFECMRRVCETFGVGDTIAVEGREPADATTSVEEDDDEWLDLYFDEDDLDMDELDAHDIMSKKIQISRLRYGWPDLQVDVLKECMEISEAADSHAAYITYALRLLNRLYKHLSEQEQVELLEAMHTAAARSKALEVAIGPNNNPLKPPCALVKGASKVPVLRRLRFVRQLATGMPYPHPRSSLDGTVTAAAKAADPFLYNPFAAKTIAAKGNKDLGRDVILIVNEPAYFDVTLANPFSFDLEVQSLLINTTGIPFKPRPISTVIPAESRSFTVRLSGIPLAPGTLLIKGCTVRLFAGAVEEDIAPLQRLLDDPRQKTKDGRRKRQDERERFGKKRIEFSEKRKEDGSVGPKGEKEVPEWSLPIKVIPEQPLVQVVRESLLSPGPMMLFEGERATFPIHLENIGTTPVDFLTLGFAESYLPEAAGAEPIDGAAEEPEDVYERDVHDRSIRVFWLEKEVGGRIPIAKVADTAVERIPVALAPGGKVTIVIGALGKKWSTGGTIKLDYGHVGSLKKPSKNQAIEDAQSSPTECIQEPTSPPDDHFYTRQILIPVLMTVQPALQPLNMDILLLSEASSSSSILMSTTPNGAMIDGTQRNLSMEEMTLDAELALLQQEGLPEEDRKRDHCLFTFDLRNVWRSPFEVVFEVFDGAEDKTPSHSTKTIVHAGMTKRILLPIKRIHLPSATTTLPIPQPDWKQFVVGKTRRLSPSEDRERRTLFWYREALVGGVTPLQHSQQPSMTRGRIVATWYYSQARVGSLSLRGLRLRRGLLSVLKREEVRIEVKVVPFSDYKGGEAEGTGDADHVLAVKKMKKESFQIGLWETAVIEWSVWNLKDRPFQPLLRILPHPDPPPTSLPITINTPTDDRSTTFHSVPNLLFGGPLQTPLSALAPSEKTTYALPVVPTGHGRIRILWHLEDITSITPTKSSRGAVWEEDTYWGGDGILLDIVDKVER